MGCPTENTPGLWGPQSEAGLAHGGRAATYLLTSPCAAWDLRPQKGPCLGHSKRSVVPPWATWVQAGGPAPPQQVLRSLTDLFYSIILFLFPQH